MVGTTTVRRNHRKRYLMGGFGAVAFALSIASASYACTIFLGQGTLQGNADNPATGKRGSVTVVGDSGGMGYCNSAAGDFGVLAPGSGHTYVDRVGPPRDPANSVDLTLSPTTDCVDRAGSFQWGGQLPDGLYNVNFQEGPAYSNTSDDSRAWAMDCMYNTAQGRTQTAKKVGEVSVVAGSAAGSFNLGSALLPNTPADEAALCVSNVAGAFTDANGTTSPNVGNGVFGLQLPITVL